MPHTIHIEEAKYTALMECLAALKDIITAEPKYNIDEVIVIAEGCYEAAYESGIRLKGEL